MSLIVKITGLIIVFGACMVTGTDFSGRLRRNRRQAALMGQYWGDFLRQMELTAAPPGSIARTLAERSGFREFPFARCLAGCRGDFEGALKAAAQESDLTQAMRKAIQPLAGILGSTPMETERQALLGVLAAVRQEEKYWAEQESRQGTLYRRLGVLGGLALVVLLM